MTWSPTVDVTKVTSETQHVEPGSADVSAEQVHACTARSVSRYVAESIAAVPGSNSVVVACTLLRAKPPMSAAMTPVFVMSLSTHSLEYLTLPSAESFAASATWC